jgi:hypothetical protein
MVEQKMGITRFMDMHSGGDAKIERDGYDQNFIYIESPTEKLGIAIFEKLYDRDPDNITCECCGQDYSVGFEEDIIRATAYERGCDWDESGKNYIEKARYSDYQSLEEYLKNPHITFIPWDKAKKALGIP